MAPKMKKKIVVPTFTTITIWHGVMKNMIAHNKYLIFFFFHLLDWRAFYFVCVLYNSKLNKVNFKWEPVTNLYKPIHHFICRLLLYLDKFMFLPEIYKSQSDGVNEI